MLDLFGPYPLNISKRDMGPKVWVLNMVDYFTKAAEFVVVHTKEPSNICRLFYDHWICRYGVPSVVTTDNGTEFQVNLHTCLNDWALIMCSLQ